MAKFKCLSTGNIFEFKYEVDIISMRKHPEYVEVLEDSVVEITEEIKPKRKHQQKNQTSDL